MIRYYSTCRLGILATLIATGTALFAQTSTTLQSALLAKTQGPNSFYGPVVVDPPAPAQGGVPPNTTCDGAVVETLVVGSSVVRTGDNTGALVDGIFGVPLVWEAFTISECANVRIEYCGTSPAFSGGALLRLGLGCPLSNFVFIPQENVVIDLCVDENIAINVTQLAAGTYYYPVMMVAGTSEGPYTITFAATACTNFAPANATCDGAISLNVNSDCVPTAGSTANATVVGTTDGGCEGGDPSDGVWFSFVATGTSNTITVDPSSGINAVVDVFTAPCASGGLVNCSVAPDVDVNIEMTLNGITEGETYYVRVYDWYAGESSSHDFTICITGGQTVMCEANAGTLTAVASSLCIQNGSLIGATPNGDAVVPIGFQTVYLLTLGMNNVIVAAGSTPEFDVTGIGMFTIHTLVYDPTTLDLGFIEFGVTLAQELESLLIQGGGEICASVDVNGAVIQVLNCIPTNDNCGAAIMLPIIAEGNCPGSGVVGDNTFASEEAGNTPGCDATVESYADVWYMFNSGANTEVTIDLDRGTMEDWGVTVSEACGGAEVLCAITPQAPIVFATVENTTYWVRIYTNLEFGVGGAFGLCISGASPTIICTGGTVSTSDAMTAIDICQDGESDVVGFTTTSGSIEEYAYILSNDADEIVSMVAGNSMDLNALPLGSYRVYGVSHNGDLVGTDPGAIVSEVTTTGSCLELSSNFVSVNVEICSGIKEGNGTAWSLFPNPTSGSFDLRYSGTTGATTIDVIDVDGRLVFQDRVSMSNGQLYHVATGTMVAGMYNVRLTTGQDVKNLRLMVR